MTSIPFAPSSASSPNGGAIAFPCLSPRPGSGTKVGRTTFCGAEQFGIRSPNLFVVPAQVTRHGRSYYRNDLGTAHSVTVFVPFFVPDVAAICISLATVLKDCDCHQRRCNQVCQPKKRYSDKPFHCFTLT